MKKKPSRIEPVKLITGLISSDRALFEKARAVLSRGFGDIDCASDIIDFTHTDYYREEFGENLLRVFFSFKRLVSPERSYRLKLFTDRIERRFAGRQEKRRINIDPGYLTLANVVLLTTKNYSHRVYLGSGIYAENTLYYKDGTYHPWHWTYPDYRTNGYIEYFNKVRSVYHEQLSAEKCG